MEIMVDRFNPGSMGTLFLLTCKSHADQLQYNFSYGTPPYITVGHYDVPVLTLQVLTEAGTSSIKHIRAAECYIALCQLTTVLGDILPLLYHIRSGNDAVAAQQVSKSEVDLRTWLAGLPPQLCLHDYSRRCDVPGLANLQLSYLAVKMLLARIVGFYALQHLREAVTVHD